MPRILIIILALIYCLPRLHLLGLFVKFSELSSLKTKMKHFRENLDTWSSRLKFGQSKTATIYSLGFKWNYFQSANIIQRARHSTYSLLYNIDIKDFRKITSKKQKPPVGLDTASTILSVHHHTPQPFRQFLWVWN